MRKRIKAASKRPATINFELAPVTIKAAEADANGKKGPPRFDVVAYTGGMMNIEGYDLPVVVDLGGMSPGNNLVANLDHKSSQRVGIASDYQNDGKRLELGGTASAATAYRDEVVNSANDGFTWQSSIEAVPHRSTDVAEGKSVDINGRSFTGPFTWIKSSTLKGFAFVSHGADDNTTATIAAKAASSTGAKKMDPKLKAFIEAMGFDPEEVAADESRLATVTAAFNGLKPSKPAVTASGDDLESILARQRAEQDRITAISNVVQKTLDANPRINVEAIEAIARLAVEGKWPPDRFELEILRAQTPSSADFMPRASARDSQVTSDVLEAAVCRAGNLKSEILEKRYKEQTLEAADKRFKHGIGLNELILCAARAHGYRGDSHRVDAEAQRFAFGYGNGPGVRAAFSNIDLPGILSNIQNKFLLEGWGGGDMTCMRISGRASHTDFKTRSSYRLNDYLQYEEVGPTGELKHGKVGETTYTNQLKTHGVMINVTRTDYYNDDLGAFTSFPKALGVAGIEALNRVFWTKFLDNSNFFKSGNSNVSTGGGSALGLTGLSAATTVFLKQTKPNGEPVAVRPEVLLVPPELKDTADTLMTSRTVVGGSSVTPDNNTFVGRYRVESAPYMSNSLYTGYSTTAWYLLSLAMAVIEIAFLNGREMPVIEQAEAGFNVLGFSMRAYHDFGVELQEYRGGVRSAGT